MGFLWPAFLLCAMLIPIIVAAYLWILGRRKRYAIHYSSISLIREAMPSRIGWRRHLPFALFLTALLMLIVTMARPVAAVTVPSNQSTVVLALDVSLSMCASDIEPNRLTVAQEAAKRFIENQPNGSKIAVVAFAGIAELVVPPTDDKDVLLRAVDNLTTDRRTAIGSAILRSIDAISTINDDVPAVNVYAYLSQMDADSESEPPVQPDMVVLLTDGASNSGALPLLAARAAADRGVRVYTVGFGTPRGSPFQCTRDQLGAVSFGRGFTQGSFNEAFSSGRGGFRRGIDEDTLMTIADMTGAEYFSAESADELIDVFSNVGARVETQKVETENGSAFAGLGALLAVVAVALGRRWNPLP